MPLKLMYITNNIEVAKIAQENDVDRIFVDLEYIGKNRRQKDLDTVKSSHSIEDINKIKAVLTTSELLVRVNPINPNSEYEIDKAIQNGADVLMLPMFKTIEEVSTFLKFVKKRTRTCLLLETIEAENLIDDLLLFDGIDEIYIGLNDLHLSHKKKFMFELLADGTVERLSKKIKRKGIPFGFGGISRLGTGMLSADNIVAEHYRLGSSIVILSRSFCNYEKVNNINEIKRTFRENIDKLRNFEEELILKDSLYFFQNQKSVISKVRQIVNQTL